MFPRFYTSSLGKKRSIKQLIKQHTLSGEPFHIGLIQDENGHFFSWKQLVELAIDNPSIGDFFEHNAEVNTYWQMRLKEKGYIDFPLYDFSGVQISTVFTQYKGAYFWAKYSHSPDRQSAEALVLLEQAC